MIVRGFKEQILHLLISLLLFQELIFINTVYFNKRILNALDIIVFNPFRLCFCKVKSEKWFEF